MGADDIEPSRMEATKLAAKSFVEGQPENVRIGVVSFSDGGLVVQEPSYDRVEIVAAINRLAPQSGTSLGHGIMAALNASLATEDGETGPDGETEAADRRQVVPSGAFAPAIIVLLSDGENMSDPDPMEAAQVAIEQGVRIYTVGIGSTEGTTLTIDGFNIVTRLDEAMLQDIASISEGRYVNATSVEELEEVYDSIDPQFVVRREKFEVTPIFSGLSLVTLMIGGAVSLVWFGRVP
jgi:Ca-activated chloride channel family protein